MKIYWNMELLLENFWNEKFWLPQNLTWKNFEPGIRNGINYRNYNDLLWAIPLAIIICVIRSLFVKYIFIPFGRYLNIKSRKVKIPFQNAVLEKMYKSCRKFPSKLELQNLVKQTDLSQREIERWWSRRRLHDRPSNLEKFTENCWHFLFYSLNFIFGLCVLWNKSWLWNFIDMFRDYPNHSIDNGLWWYYNITLGFYISLSFLHFFETRRKDFWQMLIHHILTLALITVSWTVNAFRGGSLVIFIHDIADVLLEGVKAINYAKYERLGNFVFILFTKVWIITRLVMFSRVVYCGIVFFPKLFAPYPLFYFLGSLCISLLFLHFLWTYMIFKMIYRMFTAKKLEDIRSSSEDENVSDCGNESSVKLNGNCVDLNGNCVKLNGNGAMKNGH